MNEKKNKHMTFEDRVDIQECLCKGMTFKAIGKRIGKDQTTISKEVKLHAVDLPNAYSKLKETCPKLLKAPFVCNGCEKKRYASCQYMRRQYVAKTAQEQYQTTLVESREGIPLNRKEFYDNEEIISRAVKNGQHIYHAIKANNLTVSKSTVYRHINKGYYTILPVDLPRAVKFKPRKRPKSEYVPAGLKVGRSYEDFLAFIAENPFCNYVEMDTVIGRVGGKVIMTFQFVEPDFMFGLLLEDKTAAEAADKIRALKSSLSGQGFSFSKFFPVILTDNGGEFSNVFAFENDLNGSKETSVFFCDPNASYQKPHVEHNHTMFRDIAPKGTSFDSFTQDTVNTIFSHVNSVKREQFNGKSSFEMFSFLYSSNLANLLGIVEIDPKQVIQSTKLLSLLGVK